MRSGDYPGHGSVDGFPPLFGPLWAGFSSLNSDFASRPYLSHRPDQHQGRRKGIRFRRKQRAAATPSYTQIHPKHPPNRDCKALIGGDGLCCLMCIQVFTSNKIGSVTLAHGRFHRILKLSPVAPNSPKQVLFTYFQP